MSDEEGRSLLKQSFGFSKHFEDPISLDIMVEAVSTSCGHSFSAVTIAGWLKNHNTCPSCNHPLKATDVAPNYTLRATIASYQASCKAAQEQAAKKVALAPPSHSPRTGGSKTASSAAVSSTESTGTPESSPTPPPTEIPATTPTTSTSTGTTTTATTTATTTTTTSAAAPPTSPSPSHALTPPPIDLQGEHLLIVEIDEARLGSFRLPPKCSIFCSVTYKKQEYKTEEKKFTGTAPKWNSPFMIPLLPADVQGMSGTIILQVWLKVKKGVLGKKLEVYGENKLPFSAVMKAPGQYMKRWFTMTEPSATTHGTSASPTKMEILSSLKYVNMPKTPDTTPLTTSGPDSLPPGWVQKTDANGHIYFENDTLHVTQWDRPTN
ncbi:hypothetical protein Pelo_11608 [Pelomyxa schiedti]|nr:hypothetical protein Pelo_11608 [Pelomyxa schiedti]